METKKTITADLENQKGLFLLIGFVLVFGFFFIAFEWNKQTPVYSSISSITDFISEDEIISTNRVVTPPPAPLPATMPIEINPIENTVQTTPGIEFSSEPIGNVSLSAPLPIEIEEPDVVTIFDVPQVQPTFPGGVEALYKFLYSNVNYPYEQRIMGIQGKVVCQFVVNTDGSIVDVVVAKGVDPELDKEAVRVIQSMPNWIPGEQAKKKVRVRFTLPVIFQIKQN